MKRTRWIIVNDKQKIIYTGVCEDMRRTAIWRHLNQWWRVGEKTTWDECRKKGDRAVKIVIEVENV